MIFKMKKILIIIVILLIFLIGCHKEIKQENKRIDVNSKVVLEYKRWEEAIENGSNRAPYVNDHPHCYRCGKQWVKNTGCTGWCMDSHLCTDVDCIKIVSNFFKNKYKSFNHC